jgi:hypothetical protein
MPLQIGYAQQVITPPLDPPVYLAGFAQNRVATAVHDELYIRALAITDGAAPIALVAVDLIGLVRPYCQQIEASLREKIPDLRVLIAATHVHHAPDTIGLWGPDGQTHGVNLAYLRQVLAGVEARVLEAFDRLAPALVKAASAQVTGLMKNSRDADVLDEELTALQFVSVDDQKPLATALIYPCHPEVLWDDNTVITSDYGYTLRARVETVTGAPALYTVGALGGMLTPAMPDHSFESAERMGETLAQAALALLDQTPAQDITRIEHHRREFTVPLQNPLLFEIAALNLLPAASTLEDMIVIEANLLKIGPAWLLTVPGELFPKIGLALKAEMKSAGASVAAIIGLVNDEIGYIVPKDEFVYPENPYQPTSHYEESMSYGPETAPLLVEAVRALIAGGSS